MNRALKRLIKKYFPESSMDYKTQKFINEIEIMVSEEDKQKRLMENAINASSQELNEINISLKNDKAFLNRVIAQQNALFDASQEAIFSFTNENIINKMNQAGLEFLNLGRSPRKGEILTCDLFMNQILNKCVFSNEIQPIRDNPQANIQGKFETVKGRIMEYYSVPEICDGERIGRVWCCRDITDIEKNQDLLSYQANHDDLTSLPNRLMLLECLEDAIFSAKENNEEVAVLFIDLDDFKKINDTAGHEKGDEYLIEFSSRLNESLRVIDMFGRLGGDEFLIILEGIKDKEDVVKITEKIIRTCNEPFFIDGKEYHMSCSIGIAMSPSDSISPKELIRLSDMAMYQSKKLGKNQYQFFDKSLEKIALNRVILENDLRKAIKNNDFTLHYQPKINLESNEICGVEALIRWNKEGSKLIFPDQFIPVAEDTGLIRNITYWLIKEACNTLKRWEESVLNNASLSINISANDFSDNYFIESALKIIDESDIDTSLLEFELTESVLFEDIESAKENIRKLKSRDIKISIDDFGTGFSSFSYLLDMEIDFLKIDKSFVMGAINDAKAKAIVKSIIDIGINLGLKVVGEGVESNSEMSFLRKEGCHIGQGYFMSRPIPEDDLLAYAEKEQKIAI